MGRPPTEVVERSVLRSCAGFFCTNADHVVWRRKLQAAYAFPGYADAKRALTRLVTELTKVNVSAARSLEEGLEETLTLHRLDVVVALSLSFKTTNLIETIMARVDATTLRVDRWRTSDQKLRWCAAALLAVEPRLRLVKNIANSPCSNARWPASSRSAQITPRDRFS